MKPLIAGNWKMHKTPSDGVAWLDEFLEALEDAAHAHADLLLCVPYPHIADMARAAEGTDVAIGAQDVSAHGEGAYTGEVSAAMVRDAGATWTIVGHSERRQYHREDDALVRAKVAAAIDAGLRTIVCIGESEAQRNSGEAEEVVLSQLRAALEGLAIEASDELVIAYEPVWAIGTGRTATAEDAQQMGSTIRQALDESLPDAAAAIRILYGGSMKPSNAAELLAKPDVDGGLIGGASLRIDDLLGIVAAAR